MSDIIEIIENKEVNNNVQETSIIKDENIITIETSISDVFDRLSILDVKVKKIDNVDKKKHIIYEKNKLEEKIKLLKNNNETLNFNYNILININEKIWDLLDEAKYEEINNSKQLILFKQQEDYNERRFRVKSKIDNILSSKIKEQKGYKFKKAMVLGHLGMGDQFYIVGMVRYLSTIYDEVLVVCKKNTEKNVKQIYSDDNTIKIMSVASDSSISPVYGFNINNFNKIFSGYQKYLLGFHQHGIQNNCYGQGKIMYDLPFSFYDDVRVPYNIFWDYFYINKTENSIKLYNTIKENSENIKEYIFVHNTSSIGEVYNLNFVVEKFKLNIDETLIVNPCVNMYNEEHKFYKLAETFTNLPLLDCVDLIKNANIIIMSDSGFLPLAVHLEIQTNKCFMYCRQGGGYSYTYDHFWSNKYGPTNTKLKKFKQIN